MYFPPAFFDVSIHFTTHLIKEIKLLHHMFLHQMYAYEKFNGMVQGYYTEGADEYEG
jgi:hypothetical protein